jgi:hypothetical protein
MTHDSLTVVAIDRRDFSDVEHHARGVIRPGAGVAIAIVLVAWLLTIATAADKPMKPMTDGEHQTKAGNDQMEAGPATIDVSAYPKAAQDTCLLFTEKCAQCHHLNHTINSDHHALPDEWEEIVSRMWRKPGSNMNKAEAKQIVEFLTYDSSVRRKAAVDKMLAEATPEERKAAEEKIKDVHAKYDQHLRIAVKPISQRRLQPKDNSEQKGMKDMDKKPAGDHKEHQEEQK